MDRNQFVQTSIDAGIESPRVINKMLSESTNDSIIEEVKSTLKSCHGRSDVDVIIGGPPCQSYSLAGRGKNGKKAENDPRNYLYHHYLHFLKVFKPRLFIFENVPGLISAKRGTIFSDVIDRCSRIGYHLDKSPHILNALDFEVVEDRQRIIFIGWKARIISVSGVSQKTGRGHSP